MTGSIVDADPRTLLGIYLNDHLMGATGGVRLARRASGANAGTPFATPLEELTAEISEDRRALLELMGALGVATNPFKVVAGAVGERLGRLKPNGRLTDYSPLSRVLELEALYAGVNAKLRMWLAVQQLDRVGEDVGTVDLGRLIARAEAQLDRLEALRLEAVTVAFGDT